MDQFVGLDVSQKYTSVCVVDNDGTRIWAGRCLSTPSAIAACIQDRAPSAKRIGFETGPLSIWHYNELRAKGLPVVCIDARHAKSALRMQLNKTDDNDAFGLAQVMRTGWFRAVHVKSGTAQIQRALLQARQQLGGMQREIYNQVRGTLKVFGILVPTGKKNSFDAVVRKSIKGRDELPSLIEPLLSAWQAIGEQVKRMTIRIKAIAGANPTVRLLTTVPGVGYLTGLAFVSTLDDPARFTKSRNVGAHLGLSPRRYQSGAMDYTGHISKCGDSLLRCYLYEAAGVLLHRVRAGSALQQWGLTLTKRIGFTKARVAVARKLSVILHKMWISGAPFCSAGAPAAV